METCATLACQVSIFQWHAEALEFYLILLWFTQKLYCTWLV